MISKFGSYFARVLIDLAVGKLDMPEFEGAIAPSRAPVRIANAISARFRCSISVVAGHRLDDMR